MARTQLGALGEALGPAVDPSGGAGWRDSARREARVGATRDGDGVEEVHGGGAGWRDPARAGARVGATQRGDGNHTCAGVLTLRSTWQSRSNGESAAS